MALARPKMTHISTIPASNPHVAAGWASRRQHPDVRVASPAGAGGELLSAAAAACATAEDVGEGIGVSAEARRSAIQAAVSGLDRMPAKERLLVQAWIAKMEGRPQDADDRRAARRALSTSTSSGRAPARATWGPQRGRTRAFAPRRSRFRAAPATCQCHPSPSPSPTIRTFPPGVFCSGTRDGQGHAFRIISHDLERAPSMRSCCPRCPFSMTH